jgi:hypothetical protein
MLSRRAQRREHRCEIGGGDAAIDAQHLSVRVGELPRGGRDLRSCRRSCRRGRDLHRDEPKILRRRGCPRGQLPLPPSQPAWLDAMCCSEVGSSFPALLPGLDQPCPLPRALATRLLCSISHANARTANEPVKSRGGPRNRYACAGPLCSRPAAIRPWAPRRGWRFADMCEAPPLIEVILRAFPLSLFGSIAVSLFACSSEPITPASTGSGVVAIDVSKLVTMVVDISGGVPGAEPGSKLHTWAREDQEVVIQLMVPASAVSLVP